MIPSVNCSTNQHHYQTMGVGIHHNSTVVTVWIKQQVLTFHKSQESIAHGLLTTNPVPGLTWSKHQKKQLSIIKKMVGTKIFGMQTLTRVMRVQGIKEPAGEVLSQFLYSRVSIAGTVDVDYIILVAHYVVDGRAAD